VTGLKLAIGSSLAQLSGPPDSRVGSPSRTGEPSQWCIHARAGGGPVILAMLRVKDSEEGTRSMRVLCWTDLRCRGGQRLSGIGSAAVGTMARAWTLSQNTRPFGQRVLWG
jgi:hypothetical protein